MSISLKELGIGSETCYPKEELEEHDAWGYKLYSGTWLDWIDRCCSEMTDCEIAFNAKMISIYKLSEKLWRLYARILWGVSQAKKTFQSTEVVYFLSFLQRRFEETFSIWYRNWIDFGPMCSYWHPYENACLGANC